MIQTSPLNKAFYRQVHLLLSCLRTKLPFLLSRQVLNPTHCSIPESSSRKIENISSASGSCYKWNHPYLAHRKQIQINNVNFLLRVTFITEHNPSSIAGLDKKEKDGLKISLRFYSFLSPSRFLLFPRLWLHFTSTIKSFKYCRSPFSTGSWKETAITALHLFTISLAVPSINFSPLILNFCRLLRLPDLSSCPILIQFPSSIPALRLHLASKLRSWAPRNSNWIHLQQSTENDPSPRSCWERLWPSISGALRQQSLLQESTMSTGLRTKLQARVTAVFQRRRKLSHLAQHAILVPKPF